MSAATVIRQAIDAAGRHLGACSTPAEVLQNLANDAELDGSELADLDENLERGKNDCYVPRNLLLRAAAVDRLNVAAVSEVCRDLLQPLPS